MQEITNAIFYETAYAGVTLGAIVRPKGTLLIDAPLHADDARAWKSTLITQSRGMHRLMVLLDAHADRALGSRAINYPIIAHQHTAAELANKPAIFKGQNNETGAEWEYHNDLSGTRWRLPDFTFDHALTLRWSGLEIHVEHHPGPAPGAVWVHIPAEKIVFIGDAVIPNQPPFLAQADLLAWHETLNYLASRAFSDYTFISGRDGRVNVQQVREFREYLRSVRGRLENLAKRGGTPEETEKFVTPLLKKLSYPPEMEEFYAQRLRYGLYHCYQNQYQPA